MGNLTITQFQVDSIECSKTHVDTIDMNIYGPSKSTSFRIFLSLDQGKELALSLLSAIADPFRTDLSGVDLSGAEPFIALAETK